MKMSRFKLIVAADSSLCDTCRLIIPLFSKILCYLITNRAVTTVSEQSNHMKLVAKYSAEKHFGAAKCKIGSDLWTD